MTVFGVALVKDEADIIEHTVRRMLSQVDEVIVADNLSTDGTREKLEQLPVTLLTDTEVGYYQSRKTTRLAHLAAEKGATWVVPFDADEIWLAPSDGRISELLHDLDSRWLTAEAVLHNHVPTALDSSDPNPLNRILWRHREPNPLSKVACRFRPDLVIEQGNHSATYSTATTKFAGHLAIRHFPWRSPQQFTKKVRNGAAAYRATDLPQEFGAHWRGYGDILDAQGEAAVEGIYRQWFWSEDPGSDPLLIHDPCP